VVISVCNDLLIIIGAAGEHHAVDECDAEPSSPTLMLNSGMLQKALYPLQQQQHEMTEQLTALNSRLSTLQADLSRHSLARLPSTGLLHGNDVVIVAAVLLLQLVILWWLVRPSSIAEREAHTQ